MKRLARFFTSSLRRQLILGVAGVHAVMMSVFVFDLVERQRDFLLERQIEQTRVQAENLAVAAAAWVLSRDYAGLSELIEAQKRNPELRYAMLIDAHDGLILAHSDPEHVGQRLVDEASQVLLEATEPVWLSKVGTLTDLAVPIRVNDEVVGWARIGLGREATLANLERVVRDGALYTLAAILIGAALAWLMAGRLTRRLDSLRATMGAVAGGDSRLRADIGGHDEVRVLADGFNAMLDNLAASEQRFQMAVSAANDGIWDWDIGAHKVYYSPRWKAMVGHAEDEIGEDYEEWRSRVHPDDLAATEAAVQAHLEGRTPRYEAVFRFRHKDGHYLWCLGRGTAMRDAEGRPVRMVGTITDITALKETEAALYEEKELAQVTLASIGDAVVTTDAEGRVSFLNPAAEQLTGISQAEALGRPVTEIMTLIDEATRQPVANPVETCRRERVAVAMSNHTVLCTRDGRELAIEDSAAPIFDREGHLHGVVMVFHDVTERRALLKEMAWNARHDSLTGLVNRKTFEASLSETLERARRDGSSHAMLYLDLDLFKVVNDTCGHQAGDELLRQLTGLMQATVGPNDILARLGGDEFGVLIKDCDLERAIAVAEHLRAVIRDFRFVWAGRVFEIGVSIGLVQVGAHSGTVYDVMADADMACYAAKEKGRNRVQVHSASDAEVLARRRELEAATGIRAALDEGRVLLYAQEIRPILGGESHYEVLLRFRDEQGAIQPPAVIIPAAERYGLMGEVDRYVVQRTFELAASTPGLPELAINLSGLTVVDEHFVDFVRETINRHGIDPRRFCFEITETAAISHLGQAMSFIQEMRQLGFRFALDDFGSGMSSFAYLKNLEVDYLKIDGVFVRDIADDPVERAFVEAINRIGHVMGKKLIAEFVENEAILRELIYIGVDYAQGYGIGKPAPLDELLAVRGRMG